MWNVLYDGKNDAIKGGGGGDTLGKAGHKDVNSLTVTVDS
jgi:hypothetical protein